jgi:ribosomal protein S18 acetylase RimI-like enzyme
VAARGSGGVDRAVTSVLRIGGEEVRTGPWRGDRTVAFLAPTPMQPSPSAECIRRCLAVLAERGFRRVVTGALSPFEQTGFLAAGFQVEEELHLLAHDLSALPPAPPAVVPFRRVRRRDRDGVLAVDHLAFPPFWQLDEPGLDDALAATPKVRFRLAEHHPELRTGISGYAICGRAADRGYVQRLAVHPALHGRGLGRGLMVDGMRWMKRRGVRRAVVNTQIGNDTALELYQRLGFRLEPVGLSVLSMGIPG